MYNIKIVEKHMKWIVLFIVLGALTFGFTKIPTQPQAVAATTHQMVKTPATARMKLTKYIAHKYKISRPQALKIVVEAEKHATHSFPRTSDILAIIAIESRFQAHAVSPTNAVGLMQIVYKRSSTDVKRNIRDGAVLLKTYYRLTKRNKDSTVQAYNVGIGAFYSGARSTEYLKQFKKHKQKFEEIQ